MKRRLHTGRRQMRAVLHERDVSVLQPFTNMFFTCCWSTPRG
ncbi:MAG TPA: hypothetical protein VMW62_10100 [Chloroflexota bacterium]|nr:hypothetical protein [Chloroflexota bacterium]